MAGDDKPNDGRRGTATAAGKPVVDRRNPPLRKRAPVTAGLWRERLTASLPVLLMAALAGATWWLVRHTPRTDDAKPAVARRHEVDYDMHSFTTRRYAVDGRLQALVQGREMRRYADDGSIEIDDVRMHGLDDGGRRYNGEARLGRTDSDLRVVQLKGQAKVRREAVALQPTADERQRRDAGAMQLGGEELWMDTQDQRVRSQHPVTLLGEDGRMDAGTLDYDGRTGQTVLGQRVRGSYLVPRAGQPASAASAP